MRAKAKKTPLCPVSLIAIELKGLAAPGEALKNYSFKVSFSMDKEIIRACRGIMNAQ